MPTDDLLSPADDRLAQITLVTSNADGEASVSRDVTDPHAGLAMGDLVAGQEVSVAVELRSPTQRLLGYGRTSAPVVVEAGRDTAIAINVRRPFAYVAGPASALDAFDATLDPSSTYDSAIAVPSPLATAPTADGAEVVVVSAKGATGGELRLLSTSDHKLIGPGAVALKFSPVDVAVAADGHTAVVAHEAGGGISVVDLDALRAGAPAAATFVDLGPVGAVALAAAANPDAPPRAFALIHRSHGFGCDGTVASSIAVVSLAAPPAIERSIDLGGPIGDLAVSGDGDTVVVADPCGGKLVAMDGTGQGQRALVDLPAATSVAMIDDQVWGAGTAPISPTLGLRVALVSTHLDGHGTSRVELGPSQESAESVEFSGQDQKVEVTIDADKLRAFELSALPGSDSVALLTEGYYHSQQSGDFNGNPVVPEIELTSFEYLLVDASTRTVVQRLRTSCEGSLLSDAILTQFVCATGPDQDALPTSSAFKPTHVAVLYGGR